MIRTRWRSPCWPSAGRWWWTVAAPSRRPAVAAPWATAACGSSRPLAKTLLERTVAWAEQTGGCGARPRRAALDSPLCGAGRVEDPFTRRGQALRQAVGRAATALGTSAEVRMADARRELVGQSRRNAALELDGGAPARANARRLVLAAVERWKRWREQPPCLAAQEPPLQEVLETIGQNVAPETEPAPQGDRARGASRGTSPPTAGSPWRTPPGAPAARAAPQRSTAAKRTGPWTGTATSRARWGLSRQPTGACGRRAAGGGVGVGPGAGRGQLDLDLG